MEDIVNRLEGKVAIITGAGAGMGRADALLFAREGATVAVTDLKEADGLETVKQIVDEGGKAQFWQVNVASEESVAAAFADIEAKLGTIDILVNNAGIPGVDKPTHEVSEQEWDAVFAVDVKGVFFCTKYAVPVMMKHNHGAIVNMSSIYGLVGSDELTPYHAAKGAVTIMTKKDAIAYGPYGIRVNSIHPGSILTPLVRELASRGPGGLEGYLGKMRPKHPIGYLGEPEDVAAAVLFLASDEARFITGAALAVDGGYTAW